LITQQAVEKMNKLYF